MGGIHIGFPNTPTNAGLQWALEVQEVVKDILTLYQLTFTGSANSVLQPTLVLNYIIKT
jgi:hypothetical protein